MINSLLNNTIYMQRCLDLARQGLGYVAPNPMVGAVLVYEDRIIGEGYHQKYGEAHAEVNCIRQTIQNGHTDKLQLSTMYVSLEPCAHFGKTPPCADLIIKHKIPHVVIGCRDPFEEVNGRLNPARMTGSDGGRVGQGKGIEKLKAAGVDVITGVLEEECKEMNKRFFTFHQQHRPYVILKWAETADGFLAAPLNPPGGGTFEDSGNKRLLISNEYTNKLVHKWRSEEAGILIGTNTALLDDPELTVRHWIGPSPVRLVMDMNLRLPVSLKIFDRQVRTIIFNTVQQEIADNLEYRKILKNKPVVQQVLDTLYQLNIQSVMAEGGAKLLQSFIDEGMWDEARVIKNAELKMGSGVAAPLLKDIAKVSEQKIVEDRIEIYKHAN